MKSDYNSMNMPASLMVYLDGSVSVIERRGNLSDIVRREVEAYSEGRAAVGCS
jgi:diaminopimelate decarboxylase